MNQRQRKYQLNRSRRDDSRPPWMRLKHVSPKVIMAGNIGYCEGFSFVTSSQKGDLTHVMATYHQQVAEALAIPAHLLKEPPL